MAARDGGAEAAAEVAALEDETARLWPIVDQPATSPELARLERAAAAAWPRVETLFTQARLHLERAVDLDPRLHDDAVAARAGMAIAVASRLLQLQVRAERTDPRALLDPAPAALVEARRALAELDRLEPLSAETARERDALRRQIEGGAHLTLVSHPAGARVSLVRMHRGAGAAVAEVVEGDAPTTTPWPRSPLAAGSYLIELEAAGRPTVRCAVLLARNEELTLEVQLPLVVPAGLVYVPRGAAYVGDPSGTIPYGQVSLEAFFMGEREVTLAEYREFLRSLPAEDREAAAPLLSTRAGPKPLLLSPGLGLNPEFEILRDDLPVCGVTFQAATQYCAWRSASTGWRYGLPSEQQWEYAFRGADARAYPWGNGFDPLFTNTALDPRKTDRAWWSTVGAYERDRSPFGLLDGCGNVSEFTTTPFGSEESGDSITLKGGNFAMNFPELAILSKRSAYSRTNISPSVGFRVVALPPP